MVNEGQACRNARVRNCGSYYLYQMERPASWQYGFCVAQDQCKDARDLDDRFVLDMLNSGLIKKYFYQLSSRL